MTKKYGTTTIVNQVNLHVPKGKIYGLLGRNGAGKTTLMKMMLQLTFPTSGIIRLFGTDQKADMRTLFSKIGSIIETPGFYSNLTGHENLQLIAKLRGGISQGSVKEALQIVGLHQENRKVFADYSLGMKQRLGIAAAILHKRNRRYIEFHLSDGKIAGKILTDYYQLTDYSIQENTVKVYDFTYSAGEINTTFVNNGLTVTQINTGEHGLEDYFTNLIGGGGIA